MVKKKSIKESTSAQDVPEGIKILAVFCFIGAFISFIVGGFLFSFADNVSQNAAIFVEQGIEIPSPMTLILFGIVLLGFAVFEYFLAKEILKLKNWAKNALVILSVFGIIAAIVNIKEKFTSSGIFSLLMNGLIIWYLTFRIGTRKILK
ncbi:MAG: hypothetical protein ABIH79_01470 [archaeon]